VFHNASILVSNRKDGTLPLGKQQVSAEHALPTSILMLMPSNRAENELKANREMGTIVDGKTRGLCLVEALPAEVVALGISMCDTTRDGSRIVGNPEITERVRPSFRIARDSGAIP